MSIRAAIYARVSSAKQRDTHTIESQLLVLRRHVREQGWILAGEYTDDGRSAKTGKLEAREAFARLVRDANAGLFDVLLVVDVDRLTRTEDMRERAEILGPFQAAGVRIVTPTGGELDLRTLLGELYVTLHAIVAAAENKKRSERIKAGKVRAIAEGRKPAGPTPYGWLYVRETGTWFVHEVCGPVVREIFARVIAGEACPAIAEDLQRRNLEAPGGGAWTRQKVWRIVRARRYVGEWTVDKLRRQSVAVPPIIDEATWYDAQDKLIEHGKRGIVKSRHVYLLEGLATCAECGAPIAIRSATTNSKRTNGNPSPAAYVCRARKLERSCSARIAKVADLDDRLWAKISLALESPELAADLERAAEARSADQAAWRADADGYRARIATAKDRRAALVARFQRGLLDEAELDVALAASAREVRALEQQLTDAESNGRGDDVAPVDVRRWVAELRELARTASLEERRQIVRALVRPGTAQLIDGRVRLTLQIEEPRSATVPALVAVSSREHRDGTAERVTIRVVA